MSVRSAMQDIRDIIARETDGSHIFEIINSSHIFLKLNGKEYSGNPEQVSEKLKKDYDTKI